VTLRWDLDKKERPEKNSKCQGLVTGEILTFSVTKMKPGSWLGGQVGAGSRQSRHSNLGRN
jgi:hypothetical protein